MTSRRVSVRPPKLRHHKPTGQGYVVLNGKYIFFGPYGDPEVTEQYHRTIAKWVANGHYPAAVYMARTLSGQVSANRLWMPLKI
jgi:hypothetical protein